MHLVPTLSVMQSNVNVQQWNTTHITCLPSQADVQIQWTFLNEVLATGFQYTYTINATSIEYEGEYACSVFGDVNKIVEPQIVYVNVIAGETVPVTIPVFSIVLLHNKIFFPNKYAP